MIFGLWGLKIYKDYKMEIEKVVNKRRLVYVDASGFEDNTKYKISMFDPDKNATHVLELKDIDDNNIAEGFAVFYAIFYIKKHDYNNCHILCDNLSAVNDKYIIALAQKYKIGISWIPREANIVADKVAKLDPTLKEKDWNTLKLFIDLVLQKDVSEIEEKENLEIKNLKLKIDELKKAILTRNEKITNQTNQIKQLRGKIPKK